MHRLIKAGGAPPPVWRCSEQLRSVFHAIPVEVAMTGMMQSVTGEFAADAFRAVVDILGGINAEVEESRSTLSDPLRQSLRRYLKDGISKLLTEDLFDDDTRAHAAIALGKVGVAEDLADLRDLTHADIKRQRSGGCGTTYSNWYVKSFLWLDMPDIDTTLVELLHEREYEDAVARALLRRAAPPNRKQAWPAEHPTDYEAIWSARSRTRMLGLDEPRAKRYAQAIKWRISELQGERTKATNPEPVTLRMKHLAIVLAVLDGQESRAPCLRNPDTSDAIGRLGTGERR